MIQDKDKVVIEMDKVNLWYDQGGPMEVHAIKEASLTIKQGEYAAFFGPSGCGKTSMLYAISGIDRYQSGSVKINTHDLTEQSNEQLAVGRQTDIGIVFQQFNLIPSLNVLQNVTLPMLFLGRNLEEASVEGLKLLERLDLVKYKDRFPFELSGGQQQRVGIARALANNPPIIIADEPLGNLDSVSAKNVLAFLKELNEKDGRTIIMVTHEAWSLQDVRKVFYMKDGAIIETKEKSATTTPENLAAVIYKDMLGPNKEGAEHEVTKTLLSHFLMRGYTTDEIIRFEEILKKRMSGAIDHDEFRLELDKPYKKGGVGLWKQKAQRVADYIEEVINGRHTMETIFKMLHDTPELSITDEVNKIALWISEEYKGQLSVSQNVLLREYVTKRIKGLYTADDFQHALDRPARTQGLGLSMRATQLFSERMEALLIDEHGPAVNLLPHTQLNVKEI